MHIHFSDLNFREKTALGVTVNEIFLPFSMTVIGNICLAFAGVFSLLVIPEYSPRLFVFITFITFFGGFWLFYAINKSFDMRRLSKPPKDLDSLAITLLLGSCFINGALANNIANTNTINLPMVLAMSVFALTLHFAWIFIKLTTFQRAYVKLRKNIDKSLIQLLSEYKKTEPLTEEQFKQRFANVGYFVYLPCITEGSTIQWKLLKMDKGSALLFKIIYCSKPNGTGPGEKEYYSKVNTKVFPLDDSIANQTLGLWVIEKIYEK